MQAHQTTTPANAAQTAQIAQDRAEARRNCACARPCNVAGVLDLLSRRSMTDRVDYIAGRCAEGDGTWHGPQSCRPGHSPGTHLHEITFCGLTAAGDTPETAVQSWERIARRQAALCPHAAEGRA